MFEIQERVGFIVVITDEPLEDHAKEMKEYLQESDENSLYGVQVCSVCETYLYKEDSECMCPLCEDYKLKNGSDISVYNPIYYVSHDVVVIASLVDLYPSEDHIFTIDEG